MVELETEVSHLYSQLEEEKRRQQSLSETLAATRHAMELYQKTAQQDVSLLYLYTLSFLPSLSLSPFVLLLSLFLLLPPSLPPLSLLLFSFFLSPSLSPPLCFPPLSLLFFSSPSLSLSLPPLTSLPPHACTASIIFPPSFLSS